MRDSLPGTAMSGNASGLSIRLKPLAKGDVSGR